MKTLALLLSFVSATTIAFSQAMPFIGQDCNGVQHNLFQDLDDGKVVVVCWVMPCGACVGPALTSFNVVKSMQEQHQGKVLLYLVDDYGNSSCSNVNEWANAYNIVESEYSYRFSTSMLSMNDYGTPGMPKVVVMGGTEHKLFFNNNGALNSTQFVDAVNTALAQTTSVNEQRFVDLDLTLSPNPASNAINVSFTLNADSDVAFEVTAIDGSVVINGVKKALQAGKCSMHIDSHSLPAGTYYVRVHTSEGTDVAQCVVVR